MMRSIISKVDGRMTAEVASLLTSDFKNQPYWWDAAPPAPLPAPALDPSYDVAIVGSGHTGLRAALTLLRGGRSVVIFDRENPGFGASRRNAGFLGRVLKKSFAQLLAKKGLETATSIYRELDGAYQSTLDFIEAEGIACHAVRCGRFVGATSPTHYRELEAEFACMKQHLGLDYCMLPRSEQRTEFATDVYFGGAVVPDLGSLHPGLYHQGLLDRVLAAGGVVSGQTEVVGLSRLGGAAGFEVTIRGGKVRARDVVVATNGYTPRNFGWHARRVIPFTAYMAATEILPDTLMAKIIPHRRTVLDSNVNIDFFRPAPDSSRILFGGATGSNLQSVEQIAARLHQILGRVLPDLRDVRLSHVWSGQCAGTFDMMPHVGRDEDGVWFGMGYNFAGVPIGSHFGEVIARGILGGGQPNSAFSLGSFPTLPFYSGKPWFVPAAMRYFDWQDRRLARKSPPSRVG